MPTTTPSSEPPESAASRPFAASQGRLRPRGAIEALATVAGAAPPRYPAAPAARAATLRNEPESAIGKGPGSLLENSRGPALDVELCVGREDFLALREEWNALVEATGDQPFYRHDYLRNWLGEFAPRQPLRLLVARSRGGRLEAALPLLARRGAVLGLPVREWSSPSDVHSFRFDLLARDPPAAARAFVERLRRERGWTMVRIADVPEGGAAHELYRTARAAGLPGGVYSAQRSPLLALPAAADAFVAGWSSKWRTNLARRRRALERLGAVSFRRIAAGDGLERWLDCCLAMEASGPKGRRGEAADQDPRVRRFYLAVGASAAGDGSLALDLLELDGRPIAFHFGLVRAGVHSLLWTGYDERYRAAAPGHLLTGHVIERSIAAGLAEFDFLGCDLAWKRSWTKTTRPHHWLFLFRPTAAGAFLARAKFGWAPAVRRLLRPARSPESRVTTDEETG